MTQADTQSLSISEWHDPRKTLLRSVLLYFLLGLSLLQEMDFRIFVSDYTKGR